MKKHVTIEDLNLLMRALHRDVSELDERLRRVEAMVLQMREASPELELRIETPSRT